MTPIRISAGALALALAGSAAALPGPADRVYTADQNTNTVSVFDPVANRLLGQIRLGSPRTDVLSPLYKGEINVHGLGFSPDHRTLLAIANGSNSVSFIDTASNTVKGKAYIGRSPHEAFFTADGKEVWAVVRGEDYISVIDPLSFKETRRVPTMAGPGMVMFTPDGKLAFVVSSFVPEVDVIDVKSYRVVKRIPVVSPFSPFLQFTPDLREVWMTHKDVGKITRIDTATLEVSGVFDTGFISNHVAFARVGGRTLAYVTVGGENAVKVYTAAATPELLATIATGALPHGIWASDDGSRIYVGLENGDGVDVLDTASNRVIARMAGGQAPQALVYVSNAAAPGGTGANLAPLANGQPVNLALRGKGAGRGFAVVRNLGIVDTLEVTLFKLKPATRYQVYLAGQPAPAATLLTNAKGMATGTMLGPVKSFAGAGAAPASGARLLVVEEGQAPSAEQAVLLGS